MDSIRKTLENNAELQKATVQLEEAQSQNHSASHSAKNAEADVEAQKIKIEQSESSLYSGNVKNPKELQDLQKDVASLKKHLTVLEERQLEAMINAETKGIELEQAKIELDLIQARLGNEHKKLFEERSVLVKELESLGQEREAVLAPIPNDQLTVYEDLRRQKRGVAVSEVQEGACSSCGTDINAALQQSARSQKLVYCPTCGRILFMN